MLEGEKPTIIALWLSATDYAVLDGTRVNLHATPTARVSFLSLSIDAAAVALMSFMLLADRMPEDRMLLF